MVMPRKTRTRIDRGSGLGEGQELHAGDAGVRMQQMEVSDRDAAIEGERNEGSDE